MIRLWDPVSAIGRLPHAPAREAYARNVTLSPDVPVDCSTWNTYPSVCGTYGVRSALGPCAWTQ